LEGFATNDAQHGNFAVNTVYTKRFEVQAFLAVETAVAEAAAVETVLESVGQ